MKKLFFIIPILILSISISFASDLKVKKRKLKKSDMTFVSHEDYKVWKKGLAAWDDIKEEMSFDVNIIESGNSWRLAYDSDTLIVIALFESDGETSSIYSLFTGTEQECLDEITVLGLEYE